MTEYRFSLCRLGQRAGISPTKESQRWTPHRAPPGKPARLPAPLLSNPTIAFLATDEVVGNLSRSQPRQIGRKRDAIPLVAIPAIESHHLIFGEQRGFAAQIHV